MYLLTGSITRKLGWIICSLFFYVSVAVSQPVSETPRKSPNSITLQFIDTKTKIEQANDWVKTTGVVAHKYGEILLESLPRPCVLLVLEDIPTLSLWTLKQEGKIPPDIQIYDFDGTFFSSLPSIVSTTNRSQTLEDIFRNRESAERELILNSKVPVYSTARRDTRDLPGYELIPRGMVYNFSHKKTAKPDFAKSILILDSFLTDSAVQDNKSIDNMLAIVHYMAGVNYQFLKTVWSKDSALLEFKEASRYSGELRGIHGMLAENFYQLGDLESARLSCLTAIQRKPDSLKAPLILLDIEYARHDYPEVIKAGLFILDKDPQNDKAINRLVEACQMTKDYDKALVYSLKALSLYPHSYSINLTVAEIYESLGKTKEALSQYQKCLSLASDNPTKIKIRAKIRHLNK